MAIALMGRWQVTLPNDEKHVFEPDEITNNEWRALQGYLDGMSFTAWLNGINNRDPKPCDVLVWFLRHKAGDTQDILAMDYPIRRLDVELIQDGETDPEALAGSEPATSTEPSTGTESDPGSSDS